jgi:ribonuclease HI
VDHTRLWEFFYGASQNRNQSYSGGVVLHLFNHVCYKIKMGLGPGTNNYAELLSLKLLLLFAKVKNVNSIHIFGDSQIVVKWVQKLQ